jgi:hypothetical protein
MRLLLSLVLAFALASPVSAYYPPRHYGYGYRNPYAGFYGAGAGGYGWSYGGFGAYQPWSSFSSPYGTTFNGGFIGPGFYMPYSYSVPAYNPYAFGFGAGY